MTHRRKWQQAEGGGVPSRTVSLTAQMYQWLQGRSRFVLAAVHQATFCTPSYLQCIPCLACLAGVTLPPCQFSQRALVTCPSRTRLLHQPLGPCLFCPPCHTHACNWCCKVCSCSQTRDSLMQLLSQEPWHIQGSQFGAGIAAARMLPLRWRLRGSSADHIGSAQQSTDTQSMRPWLQTA